MKDYASKFNKCCGRKPSVITWGIQRDKNGIVFDDHAGVYIECKKCGAKLTMRQAIESDKELDELVELAAKEWNVQKKMVLPFSFEYNWKQNIENGKWERKQK